MRGRRDGRFVFLLALCLYVVLALHLWFVCDDAFISFRYARNLAQGHGLSYNLGENPPVEGYSNFLWVLVCSVVELAHGDVTFWAPFLSLLCGAALMWSVWDTARSRLGLDTPTALAAVVVLGLFPPFALWSSGGMATMPFTLCFFVAFSHFVLGDDARSRRSGIIGGILLTLLVLLRVDGFVWAILVVGCAVLVGRGATKGFRTSLAVLVSAVAVYLFWRHGYYGRLIANTAYAKGGLAWWKLVRGGKYVGHFFLTFVTPFLAVPGSLYARRRWGRRGDALAVSFWATAAYAVVVGGDFMAMGRFLVPGLPFLGLLTACFVEEAIPSGVRSPRGILFFAASVVVLGLLPVWNLHVVPRAVRSALHFRYNAPRFRSEMEQLAAMKENSERWRIVGLTLADRARPGDSIVSPVIGNLGYYSRLHIYDTCGLVSPEVAARPLRPGRFSPGHDKLVSPTFFLPRRPTYVFAELIEDAALAESVRTYLAIWAPALKGAPYVPDLLPVTEGTRWSGRCWVLVMRRLRPGEQEREAWTALRSKMEGARAAMDAARVGRSPAR